MLLSDIQILVFEITSYCNLKCPQCGRIDEAGNVADYVKLQHWDLDTILVNLQIDQLSNLKCVWLEGDMGDALMHPKLEEIIDAFYNLPNSPKIGIVTNGALRTADWWYNLGFKYKERLKVQFSIDGLKDTHKLYRVNANYDVAIANASAFIAGGGYATHRCLLFKHNQHQLDEIASISKRIGFKEFKFQFGEPLRFRGFNQWPVFDKGILTHHIESPTIDANVLNQYTYNADISWQDGTTINDNDSLGPCTNLKKGQIHITYKGHVIPCCVYSSDLYFTDPTTKSFRNLVGNFDQIDLNTQKLSDILNNDYFSKLNDMLLEKKHPGKCEIMCGDLIELDPVPIKFIPRLI